MNLPAIGNSFSQDAARYLHGIARSMGKKWNTANLYIGGCSLDRHFRNMHSGQDCPFRDLDVPTEESLLSTALELVDKLV